MFIIAIVVFSNDVLVVVVVVMIVVVIIFVSILIYHKSYKKINAYKAKMVKQGWHTTNNARRDSHAATPISRLSCSDPRIATPMPRIPHL